MSKASKSNGIAAASIDHLVLTVADMDATLRFYCEVLSFDKMEFGDGRLAVGFGPHKINLHPANAPLKPHAKVPVPGSADLCLLCETPVSEIQIWLNEHGITIEEGPVRRTGARRPLESLYVRDPDGNLIELANEL